jgi:DNA-binding transcriptional MerR regulator
MDATNFEYGSTPDDTGMTAEEAREAQREDEEHRRIEAEVAKRMTAALADHRAQIEAEQKAAEEAAAAGQKEIDARRLAASQRGAVATRAVATIMRQIGLDPEADFTDVEQFLVDTIRLGLDRYAEGRVGAKPQKNSATLASIRAMYDAGAK